MEIREIADKYPRFTPDEIQDWISNIHKRMSDIVGTKSNHKKLDDWLIENTEVWSFLDSTAINRMGIILKSKGRKKVEINTEYTKKRIVQLLREITVNPFTKKGHTHPRRKTGRPKGEKTGSSVQSGCMHDLYIAYMKKYSRTRNIYNFIESIFDAAKFPITKDTIKKGLNRGN